jgi:hypothetical protein
MSKSSKTEIVSTDKMIWLWVGVVVWAGGALIIGAVAFPTGDEHPRMTKEERGWMIYNLAIWPMWAVVIAIAVVARHIREHS